MDRRTPREPARRQGGAARQPRSNRAPERREASRRSSRPQAGRDAQRSARSSRASSGRPASSSRSRTRDAGAYNAPSLWTKDAPRSPSDENLALRILRILGRALLALIGLLGAALLALLRAMVSLASRSRAALAVMVLAAVLLVGGAVDFGLNYGKAYPGVRVGEIDVAGKTVDEIETSIEQAYGPRLESNTAIVYANDDAEARVNDEMTAAQDAALAEQLAVEEARANKLAWTTSASDLGATLPARALAEEAVAAGRSDGGIFARIGALFGGRTIQPRADYASDRLEQLASDIDATIGDPRVDFNVAVNGGVATVVRGHDGSMVNRGDFARSLDQALLAQEAGQGSFVARAEHAPLRIDETAAQAVADAVNRAIADGAQFNYNGSTWKATPSDMGAWIATRIDEGEGSFALSAYIDEAQAKPSLLTHVEKLNTNDPVRVTFEANEGDVAVHTDGTGTMPLVAEGVHALNDALFGPGGKAEGSTPGGSPIEVSITEGPAPATLSFDEAMDLGIISSIASYTTQFTTGAGTENRNHNIKLVSQLLSNSVVKPGGSWSFNKTAGECNEERGFLGAGAIIDGQYDDAVGGGICQVATTMFNAVYEAGYPVKTRHNHSLYISSYPAGRDAAVSWPDLDLVWENDGASDVLVRLSCTDGSVTATLYGVDPGYQVASVAGEWSEGKHYSTKTKVDESLAPGSSYIKIRGTDGRKITVVRTVKDETGSILHEDPFYSVYDPVTEVVVKGPDADSDETNT